MLRINIYLPVKQMESLKDIALRLGISYAEVMRRINDHCLQAEVTNQVFPTISGYMQRR